MADTWPVQPTTTQAGSASPQGATTNNFESALSSGLGFLNGLGAAFTQGLNTVGQSWASWNAAENQFSQLANGSTTTTTAPSPPVVTVAGKGLGMAEIAMIGAAGLGLYLLLRK